MTDTMTDVDEETIKRLLTTAKLLYANATGCAVNHYGADFALQGLPGWLADCAADIEAAEALGARAMAAHLAKPVPAGAAMIETYDLDRDASGERAIVSDYGDLSDDAPAKPAPEVAELVEPEHLAARITDHVEFLACNASGFNLIAWDKISNDILAAAATLTTLSAEVERLRGLDSAWCQHDIALKAAEAEAKRLREALGRLVTLNDEHSPFGGEMYQDRVERAWDAARAALRKEAGHE